MVVRRRTQSLRAVWAPSLARRVLRSRMLMAGLVAVIGTATSLALMAQVAAIEAERASWGAVATVAVVTQQVAAGELVDGAFELRELPIALIADDAVTSIDRQSRAKVALFPGEVVLAARLTGAADTGFAPGTVALTLPILQQVPLLAEGDLVDLWMVDSANLSSHRVADRVTVLAFSDNDVTVAVPEAQVAAATVASLRPVTITLVG